MKQKFYLHLRVCSWPQEFSILLIRPIKIRVDYVFFIKNNHITIKIKFKIELNIVAFGIGSWRVKLKKLAELGVFAFGGHFFAH